MEVVLHKERAGVIAQNIRRGGEDFCQILFGQLRGH